MKKYTITVNGTAYEVEVEDMGGAVASAPKLLLRKLHRHLPLLPHRKLLHRHRLQNL